MKLKEITPGLSLTGIEPTQIVSVVATVPVGDGALQLIYRTPDGGMKERLLGSADEASISVATAERPFSFDGDGAAFQLACEAKRIDLAFLFDPMMAVHTSNVEPLPHQITGVYESMLPRQPLRFLLADDPGAGKTIMAGLYIRELIMRADARRILIVAPGSLVEQWRERGSGPGDWVHLSKSNDGTVFAMTEEPVLVFIPEHADIPSLKSGQEMWVEVTVPAKGPPRPIRIGIKKDGVITPLKLS